MERDPDRYGPFGKAWLSRRVAVMPDYAAWLGAWLIYRPGAHIAWDYWIATLCHLRPTEGVRDAFKQYPEAEYELMVMALSRDVEPNIDTGEFLPFQEKDLIVQFHGVSDADASRILSAYVETVVNGGANPDSDYRRWWKQAIDKTVEHYKKGLQPEN